MDITLSKIVRNAGLKVKFQYNDGTQNFDHVIYKFGVDEDLAEGARRTLTEKIRGALNSAKFIFETAAFERLQRGKGPDYWAFVIRVAIPFPEQAVDRDIHGNLIFIRPARRRVPGG